MLTPILRTEIENRLAERAAMSELFMGRVTRESLQADAELSMTRTHGSANPRRTYTAASPRTSASDGRLAFFFARSIASAIALFMLPASALFLPTMSNAVP